MLLLEMWELPLTMLDAKSIALWTCTSRFSRIAGRNKMRRIFTSALVIQRSMRRALAVIHAMVLRHARFLQHLHYPFSSPLNITEIPVNLWVGYHAYSLECGPHPWITLQSMYAKLLYYGMPAPAPHRYGRGMFIALQFLRSLLSPGSRLSPRPLILRRGPLISRL